MKSLDQIQKEMLVTHDPVVLFELLNQAIENAKFQESRWAFAHGREQKLKQQVERQAQMITNLENTLFGRKK